MQINPENLIYSLTEPGSRRELILISHPVIVPCIHDSLPESREHFICRSMHDVGISAAAALKFPLYKISNIFFFVSMQRFYTFPLLPASLSLKSGPEKLNSVASLPLVVVE